MLDLARLRILRLEENSFGIEDKGFDLSYRLELHPQDSLHFEDNPRITIEYFESESSKQIRLANDSTNQNIPPLPSRDLKPKRYPSRGLIRGGQHHFQRHSNHHQKIK